MKDVARAHLNWLRPGSLRARLLLATWVATALALLLTGVALTRYFARYARAELVSQSVDEIDQLTSLLSVDAKGRAQLDSQRLLDPQWSLPYSGRYWQINNPGNQAVLRSRSLWDETLAPEGDLLQAGVAHEHLLPGPSGQTVLLVERGIKLSSTGDGVWRVMVAIDTQAMNQSVRDFGHFAILALATLMVLLGGAAWFQVRVGLAPLQSLKTALSRLRRGQAQDLGSGFPGEIQPLVSEFNQALQDQRERLERARQQAGNLAHGLKTPLAVIRQAAQSAPADDLLARVALSQVDAATRQVDWHLARARAQSTQQQPGISCRVADALATVTQAMTVIHCARGLRLHLDWDDDELRFAGDAQGLQEILGNLIDNAYQWAQSQIRIHAQALSEQQLQVRIEDDGPGLRTEQAQRVRQRGQRLDESQPGSGLGLAIAEDLTQSYGGHLHLAQRPPHGLCVCLTLPRTPTPGSPPLQH